jgi:hypothetical protein
MRLTGYLATAEMGQASADSRARDHAKPLLRPVAVEPREGFPGQIAEAGPAGLHASDERAGATAQVSPWVAGARHGFEAAGNLGESVEVNSPEEAGRCWHVEHAGNKQTHETLRGTSMPHASCHSGDSR